MSAEHEHTPGELPLVHVLLSTDAAGELCLLTQLLPPFAPSTGLHRHPGHRELCYVLEGVLAVQRNGDVLVLQAGELLTMPAGTAHAYWNPSPSAARLLLIFSPGASAELLQRLVTGEPTIGPWDTS